MVVVTGVNGVGDFVHSVVGYSPPSRVACIDLGEELLCLRRIPLGQLRKRTDWQSWGTRMFGFVLLVDATQPDTLLAYRSVLALLRLYQSRRYVIALTHSGHPGAMSPQQIHDTLRLQASDRILICDPQQRSSTFDVLFSLWQRVDSELSPLLQRWVQNIMIEAMPRSLLIVGSPESRRLLIRSVTSSIDRVDLELSSKVQVDVDFGRVSHLGDFYYLLGISLEEQVVFWWHTMLASVLGAIILVETIDQFVRDIIGQFNTVMPGRFLVVTTRGVHLDTESDSSPVVPELDMMSCYLSDSKDARAAVVCLLQQMSSLPEAQEMKRVIENQ